MELTWVNILPNHFVSDILICSSEYHIVSNMYDVKIKCELSLLIQSANFSL